VGISVQELSQSTLELPFLALDYAFQRAIYGEENKNSNKIYEMKIKKNFF